MLAQCNLIRGVANGNSGIKQRIRELTLKNFRFIPFNVAHAIESAKIWNELQPRDSTESRSVVRDDVKIMGQAIFEKIPFVMTEDASTLFKYCERMSVGTNFKIKAVKLADGFKPAALGLDGQQSLEFSKA